MREVVEQVSTALFIKDFLIENGEGYSSQVHRALKDVLLFEGYKRRRWSYANVRQFFYWLKRLGLIHRIRSEPSENPFLLDREIYAVVPGRIEDPGWVNPRKALYPKSYERGHG